MAFKWAGVLIAVVTVALDAMANLLLATLTRYSVPVVLNLFAMGIASVGVAVAFSAHLFERVNTKLDTVIELLIGRFEELEGRVGDRNTGFVEGYLLGHGVSEEPPVATVVPLATRFGARRTAGNDT